MKISRIFLISTLLWIAGCVTQPRDTSGETEVTGGLDKEKIRQTVREHVVPIQHCYEKELKATPKLQGKLVLEWDIEDLGKVTRITVRRSLQKNVDDCVAAVIKGTLFQSPPRGQIGRIVFPFEFLAAPVK